MELVSIIVPVYNVEKYLEECLCSLINQTYKTIEIILIDDGSTDSSGEICDNYEKRYSNIKVYHKKNGGVSAARNYGIEKSFGKFITFVDSDDRIDTRFIEKMVDKSKDCELVCCNYTFWYKNKTSNNKYDTHGILNTEDLKKELFKKNSIKGYSCNKLFLAEIIKKNNIRFDSSIKICEDLLFCFKYCSLIKKGYILEDNLYLYRMRKTSASNFNNDKDLTVFKAFEKMSSIDQNVYCYGKNLYAYVYFKYRKINKEKIVKVSLLKTLLDKEIYNSYKINILCYVFLNKKIYNSIKRIKQKKLEYFE